MGKVSRAGRAGSHVGLGRRSAVAVAARLGTGLRDARLATGQRQQDAADAAGLSQTRYSELERGLGVGASLQTWAVAASAVGEQLVGFLESAPGAAPPRDIEHLRRQASLIAVAEPGGWHSLPEFAVDPGPARSRSIDIVLLRAKAQEAILGEIWDWFDDVGASLRSLDGKREALVARLQRESDPSRAWTVRCLFVVRRTRRNERLLAELRPIFAARFPASARSWMSALTEPDIRLPTADGLVWSTSSYALQASRLGRGT